MACPLEMAYQQGQAKFRMIGRGFCGTVWAADRDGPASALKRGDAGGGDKRSVGNDSKMHQRIEIALNAWQAKHAEFFTHLNLPAHRQFIAQGDYVWWMPRLPRFPAGFLPCDVLITERILPFGRAARERLVERFCVEGLREQVLRSRNEEDCLVRVYLGHRTWRKEQPKIQIFSLRNKVLYVDQLEELGLPLEEYARTMAAALAVLYWSAGVDANDVEFVLAPPGASQAYGSVFLGDHALWLLDFDCVRRMERNDKGMEQAAKAFLVNDPYCPRPHGEEALDKRLWKVFVERFLEVSKLIIGQDTWPQAFVDKVVELEGQRLDDKKRTMKERGVEGALGV